jgi:isopentenyl-diphosphate Delta-isomerase
MSELADRKRAHLRLVLDGDVAHEGLTSGLERLRVRPRAFPERDLADVDLACAPWEASLAAPLLLSCMTGGVSEAGPVNRALAAAAQAHRVALGLGSGRAVLEDPSAAATFRVRDVAPDVLLLANLGAVQLHDHGVDACRRLLEACEADVLVLHVNAVQEAIQPGGDTEFAGLLERIAAVCEGVSAPVVVKEVGFGLTGADVRRLVEAGVSGVDVAGAGGTNWARVEGLREERAGRVAEAFVDWGLPTAAAIVEAAEALDAAGADQVVLIGSGGLRHGVDALKALWLGGDVAGVAGAVLAAAAEGPEPAVEAVAVLIAQLRIAAWAAGAGAVADLGPELLDT